MTFVVILCRGEFERRVVGLYRSFKAASGDAKAWDGINGWSTTVEPLTRKDRHGAGDMTPPVRADER